MYFFLLSFQIIAYQPYSLSVDWWAYGVLLYEMLAGQVRHTHTHAHTSIQSYAKFTHHPNTSLKVDNTRVPPEVAACVPELR